MRWESVTAEHGGVSHPMHVGELIQHEIFESIGLWHEGTRTVCVLRPFGQRTER
jgi:hypothetical protein